MTDEQIIKALEWHLNDETHCSACPYEEHSDTHFCVEYVIRDALDLINRQKAENDNLKRDTIPKLEDSLKRANKYGLEADRENEKLKAEIERLQIKIEGVQEANAILREHIRKAVKEFAERLKRLPIWSSTDLFVIDNLVKEMVGEG